MIVAIALAAAGMAVPPITMTVHAAPGIPPQTVKAALEEAAAIWRAPGVTLLWHIDGEAAPDGPSMDDCTLPVGPSIRVVMEDGPGNYENYIAPLGWIVFDANTPRPEVHLSHSNALQILRGAYTNGGVNQMTILERRSYLARALGRALAHEIGHYLLGSKQHTARGLMKARQTAVDLFGTSRSPLELTSAERTAALARLAEAERLTW